MNESTQAAGYHRHTLHLPILVNCFLKGIPMNTHSTAKLPPLVILKKKSNFFRKKLTSFSIKKKTNFECFEKSHYLSRGKFALIW